ncbi:glutamine amidotransferase [Cryptosporangium aurantiacum]|uniref:GMP synthase (Glutamine-hydrolysing) n=1 Tax=Cryptosporangium aurantiacum TaxID=134849 RepID=A0A1M7K1U7_9ACTN|nr:glutamine amidotransferase [Cryptosporangium aurantiacum]SHM58777.1 GMP synthase (glutamine-hydrolysing) [Cryptosporangium aurantiacum]
MKPFLLLATRAEDAAADEEYAAFLRFSGLDERSLVRHRLERTPLGRVDLDDWSGILLGGGPFNVSDPDETKTPVQKRVEAELSALIARIVDADFPFLGACYGIGTLGGHQGAVVDRTYSEPVGAVEITIVEPDPLFRDVPTTFEAFVGHKEAISVLPPHAVLLASSPGCPVQAFRIGRHVYATQFHPELDADGLCTRVDVYKYAGYFKPEEADEIKALAYRSDVRHPPAVLRAFVEQHARARVSP